MGRIIELPKPFTYPFESHVRKHGPFGYTNYAYYREWLRDEFSFRCVFCLQREQWPGKRRTAWDIDHYRSQSAYPQLALDYENLLYSCNACNSIKSDKIVPYPSHVAFGKCLRVNDDGTITALNSDGALLIENLQLDSDDYNRFRQLIIGAIQSFISSNDEDNFTRWMSYPADLPNLKRLRPQGNTRPEGVANSYYEQRKRGVLPATY